MHQPKPLGTWSAGDQFEPLNIHDEDATWNRVEFEGTEYCFSAVSTRYPIVFILRKTEGIEYLSLSIASAVKEVAIDERRRKYQDIPLNKFFFTQSSKVFEFIS